MKARKFAAHAAVAAFATAILFGTAGVGEAKKAPKDPATTFACAWEWAPVCGKVAGKKETFSNACVAKAHGAKRIKKGAC